MVLLESVVQIWIPEINVILIYNHLIDWKTVHAHLAKNHWISTFEVLILNDLWSLTCLLILISVQIPVILKWLNWLFILNAIDKLILLIVRLTNLELLINWIDESYFLAF